MLPFFYFLNVCVCPCLYLTMTCLTIQAICVYDDVRVNIKSAAQHRLYLKKSKAHSRSLLRNELIQSPDTIPPISYIIFSLSFTIHQLSLRLIYEAYFIFREFSDDRKLISSALVLLLTVAQSQSGQIWNCFNILSVSACCWHGTLYYNSTFIGAD